MRRIGVASLHSPLRSRLETLADSIPALVSYVDRELRYQYVSAGYERWFGEPREHYVGRHVRDVIGPTAYATMLPHIEQALAGKGDRFRSRAEYPTGTREVDIQLVPLCGESGEPDGIAVLVQDVSAQESQRRANVQLGGLLLVTTRLAAAQRREDIERTLVDASREALDASFAGMWRLSSDARELVLVRERGVRGLQFRRVKMTTPHPITDCVASGRPVYFRSRDEYARDYPALEEAQRPRGALPPLTFAVLPLVIEGAVIGCLGFSFHDGRELSADDRTHLEALALHGAEALRRASIYAELRDTSETRAALIQASPMATVLLDALGIVHTWNAAAERMFGVAAMDVIGRRIPAADEQPEHHEMLRRVLAGEELHSRATRRLHANGQWLTVECHAAPVTLSDGRTLCLAMFVDR